PQQRVAQTVDRNKGTSWCLVHGGQEVVWQADLGEMRELVGYRFVSANDVPERDPATWVLEGSEDGEDWRLL
ncbi:MAG: discoidin domain-containing protein, partial [Verrucomicrobiales bacterium]